MTKVIQQSFQPHCSLIRIRVPFIQLGLDQPLLIKDQASRDRENVLDKPSSSKGRKWPIREHPVRYPSQRIVRDVCQKDQCFLSGQPFLSPSTKFESTFIRLNFGLAGATVIVVSNDLRHRPVEHRTDDCALFDLIFGRSPAQHQMLDWTHVGWRIDCLGNPAIMWTKRKPIFRCDTPCKSTGPPSTTSFGQYLPLLVQGIVHVIITAKTRVCTKDSTLFLWLVEPHKSRQGF